MLNFSRINGWHGKNSNSMHHVQRFDAWMMLTGSGTTLLVLTTAPPLQTPRLWKLNLLSLPRTFPTRGCGRLSSE